ncbi:hypothetical protein ACPESR_31585 [Nocardia testacea]|uniref:hypothetical protein n=1 Tax=Nocardia testacea TaxID=248551 RepID=UPI003C2B93DD
MSAPEMVLQYINALKWPVVAVVAVALFHSPARAMLEQVQRLRVAAFGAEAEVERQAQDFAREVSAAGSEESDLRREPPVEPSDREAVEKEPVDSGTRDLESSQVFRVRPEVAWVHQLPERRLNRFRSHVESLRRFSFGGAQGVRLVTANQDDPSFAIVKIARQLQDLVEILGGYKLWPGTPEHLVVLLQEIYRIRNSVGHNTGTTVLAAHQFNVGVRDWARMYSDFLEAAIERADQIPPGASIEIIDEPRRADRHGGSSFRLSREFSSLPSFAR